jgi:predicted aldo/keto reductase-like oxidoreductase
VDYIDLYQFHNIATREAMDQVLGPGGAMEAAREAQAAGRIGHIGVTSHSMEIALELVATDQFATMMFPYNFITVEPRDRLILCCRPRCGLYRMTPMGGGLLEDATLAFKYLREEPDVISLVGLEAEAEIDEIVAIMEGPVGLGAGELARMAALRARLGSRFCRRCDYCQPCPQETASLRAELRSLRRFPQRHAGGVGRELAGQAERCVEMRHLRDALSYSLPSARCSGDHHWFRTEIVRRG